MNFDNKILPLIIFNKSAVAGTSVRLKRKGMEISMIALENWYHKLSFMTLFIGIGWIFPEIMKIV